MWFERMCPDCVVVGFSGLRCQCSRTAAGAGALDFASFESWQGFIEFIPAVGP